MADSRCCFGCSNVRKGAWAISLFNIVMCILLTLGVIQLLNFTPKPYNNSFKKSQHPHGESSSNAERSISMSLDFEIFNNLFILFLIFYVNLNLKKATYVHNVQSINQWLVVHTIFFIFFIFFLGFLTLKYSTTEFIPFGTPVTMIFLYQIYVVKNFYDDELKFLAMSDRNAGPQQLALRGNSYVTITSQPAQPISAQPVQPPSAYPVQSGPYVIQQPPHLPVTQAPYPHQLQHVQSQVRQANPECEPHAPQEYCNPPPYSPTYNTQESSSLKQ